MEDLLEEIVGQIYDEYDRAEPRPTTAGTETAPVLPGSMPIEEVNNAYGLALDDAAYTTLGGLLFGTLGRLPKAGDRIRLGSTEFEIVTMEGRRVGTVRLLTRAVPA